MDKMILTQDTVALDDASSTLIVIDQTKLPNTLVLLHLKTQKEIWEAIYSLKVRGAPAIGVAAAYGLYLAAKEIETESGSEFLSRLPLPISILLVLQQSICPGLYGAC